MLDKNEPEIHCVDFSGVNLKPWIVRHRPQADHVYPHDYCRMCGDLGFYYCISRTDPEMVWIRPCENPLCSYEEYREPPDSEGTHSYPAETIKGISGTIISK